MRKKRLYYSVSLALFLIGLFFILNAPLNVTGAVIGTSLASTSSYVVGIILLIVSIAIFAYGRGYESEDDLEERLVPPDELIRRIRSIEPDDKKRAVVIDTSSVLDYSPSEVRHRMKGYGEVFVPQSVLREIHNSKLRRVVEDNSQRVKGFESYRKLSREYLERTEKPQTYKFLAPILDSILEGKRSPTDLTDKELKIIRDKTDYLGKLAQRHKFDLRGHGMEGFKKTREFLERHCKVSDTDVDVLATAIYKGRNRKHTIIDQKDIDFEQAIDLIKKEHKKIGRYLDYTNPYPKKAA